MAYDHGFAKAYPITPNDSTDIGQACEGLFVAVAGNIVLTPAQGGSNITCTACPAGTFIPIKVKRVLATGTSATVVGLFGK